MAAVVFQQLEVTPRRRALRRLMHRGGAMFGFGVVAFFVLIAVFAPWIAPHDPLATSWDAVRRAPNAAYLFGGDELGRDVLSRIIWGARASILAGLVSVSISMALGVPIGMLAGYLGRWVDALISRLTDAMLACPFLILAIALAAFLGPSLTNAMIAIGISATPIFIRLTPPQHRRAAHRPGDARHRRCSDRRSQPFVFGSRPAAARAELGQHAQHRAQLCRPGAVDGDLARRFDFPAGAFVQPARRRPARRARPAAPIGIAA